VTRSGVPIQTLGLKHGVNPGIKWSLQYEEWDACVECGLDLWKWAQNEYPVWFKSKVVALFRLRRYVKVHVDEAVSDKSGKKK
jgi:hypothetical protein